MTVPTPPGPDASPEEIEADIAVTRARLADSVDALADKVNVKARGQEKVNEAKATAQARITDLKATAQAKVALGREKVTQGSQHVKERVLGLPRPVLAALAAAPVLVTALLVVRHSRGNQPIVPPPTVPQVRRRPRVVPVVVPAVVPAVETPRTRRRAAKA